jgi:hypothetical protein
MSIEIQSADEQVLGRLVNEANGATFYQAPRQPRESKAMPAYMAKRYRQMRRYDPRLAALDDETLTQLLNTRPSPAK